MAKKIGSCGADDENISPGCVIEQKSSSASSAASPNRAR